MFILYPLLFAILLAVLTGGRPDRLADLRLRWWGLAVGGLLVQVVLFSPAAAALAGMGPVIYVVSTAAVLVTVLANLRRPGLALVAIGAALNLAAIVANGGYMPTTAAALRTAGLDPARGYSNSVELEEPHLALLTDILAIPDTVPFANVFSVGDICIGIGIAWLAYSTMRTRPEDADESHPPSMGVEY
jgi:hypothetical protein